MPETPSTEFDVVIVTPDNIVFEGKVKQLMAPGPMQELAILPDHTPLYSILKTGDILMTEVSGKERKFPVKEGVMRVKQNKVSIILGFET